MRLRALSDLWIGPEKSSEVHASHSSAAHRRHPRLVGRRIGHGSFGGNEEPSNRRCVLHRRANHLGRIDDAGQDEVLVFLGLGIEALSLVVALDQPAGDHRPVMARVLRDLPERRLQRPTYNRYAAGLVVVDAGKIIERLARIEQRCSSTRNDAFLDCRAGRMKRIVDAVLAFLDFGFGRARRP